MFIINKKGNKTCILPILKLNFPSFMFNNIFCGIDIKKVIRYGVLGGIILVSSGKCNYSIYLDIQVYYLDIQAISTLLFFLLVIDV